MSLPPHFYERAHLPRFADIAAGHPDAARAFFAWYGLTTAPGALGGRDKALLLLAAAHALPCVYCIEAWTGGCAERGADLEEMTHAVQIAAVVRAGSVLDHGLQMTRHLVAVSMQGEATPLPSMYYHADVPAEVTDTWAECSGPGHAAWQAWCDAVFAHGPLPLRLRHLIAMAVAHLVPCPVQLRRHARAAVDAGADLAMLTEATQAAAALRGGAALIMGLQMLDVAPPDPGSP